MLILTVLQGPDKGRRFELPDNEPQLISRSSEALRLHDPTISRRHAELTPDDGKWFINDLKSSNGTFVNGRRVSTRRLLQPGDQIRTGNTIFLFGIEQAPVRRQGVRVVDSDEIDISVTHTAPSNDDSVMIEDQSEAAAVHLKVIYELTQLIGSEMETQALLERITDLIFEYFDADRGFVLLQDDPASRPDPVVVRHRKKTRGRQPAPITVSRTIVQHVMRRGEGVLSSNAMTDQRFASGDSVQNYGIRSAMCVPIKFKDRLFGVIYIDSQAAAFTYTEDQLRLLTAIGVQTGLALSNAELMRERLQRERLAAVGETVASLSHSIKNILQGLRGGADVVELGLKKDNMKLTRSGWEIVARNLERIYALTMNMLAYSKDREPELEPVSLPKLLEEIIQLVQGQFDAKRVALISDLDQDMPPVPMDAGGVHQAVLNLVQNALDAVEPDKGAVSIRCEYLPQEQQARIHVTDNGRGIDPQNRARLFEPFHSTKGLRGTGLGLVVTKKVVEEHGGAVLVENPPEQGTSFTLVLPATAAQAVAAADTHGPGAAAEHVAPSDEPRA